MPLLVPVLRHLVNVRASYVFLSALQHPGSHTCKGCFVCAREASQIGRRWGRSRHRCGIL